MTLARINWSFPLLTTVRIHPLLLINLAALRGQDKSEFHE